MGHLVNGTLLYSHGFCSEEICVLTIWSRGALKWWLDLANFAIGFEVKMLILKNGMHGWSYDGKAVYKENCIEIKLQEWKNGRMEVFCMVIYSFDLFFHRERYAYHK